MTNTYQDIDSTRALQSSDAVREANYETMVRWGAYCLVKVVPRGYIENVVGNYITLLQAISNETPRSMEIILGLRKNQLENGADIFRLLDIPKKDGFIPRGYSTLVDGLQLKSGLVQDAKGYRPGLGAWQITLTEPVAAVKIASLDYDEVFKPARHPKYL